MKTKINISNYKRVESINLFGVWFNSVYNYNYYYDNFHNDLILEICDEEFDTYQYYRIKENGWSYVKEYLGTIDAICEVWGAFDYKTIKKEQNQMGKVELNSEIWYW
jgi:hypothetical protein